MILECKNCNGKGHVIDSTILILPVIGWLIALGERNDKNGMYRDKCLHCKGVGYIKIEE
jgi:DnaJ-class molecular chaperone